MHYPAVGHCIYCGNDSGPLSDEHILMAALDGNLILDKASCHACASITSDLERIVARNMWGAYRVAGGMGRRKSKRPSAFTMQTGPRGEGLTPENVPLEKVPLIFQFPVLPAPAAITGKRVHTIDLKIVTLNPEVLAHYKGRRFNAPPMDLPVICRVLGQTALAYAVADRGGTFMPIIQDAILGRHPYPMDFVGRLGMGKPPNPTQTWSLRMIQQPFKGKNYVAVGVSLFPCYGAPEYAVVVGEEA